MHHFPIEPLILLHIGFDCVIGPGNSSLDYSRCISNEFDAGKAMCCGQRHKVTDIQFSRLAWVGNEQAIDLNCAEI